MKNVKIKSIRLLNFKGLRDLEVQFNGDVTSIYGRNASGKTTIFDAFTWLMFGKNSDDKTKFNIKTLNQQGEVIERLPHEVSAVLDIDGKECRLTKRLKEKWTKRRGSSTEEFTGNEEERLFNDVPVTIKEWNEKINYYFCTEDVFRMLTNPLYFTSLRWDKQRETLIKMAGDVSTDDIIAVNPQTFGKLVDELNGKTIDEYKREIQAKKKRIKEDVDTIPSRIDERRRSIVGDYDFALLEARLHHKEQKADEIAEQLNDARKLMVAGSDAETMADERRKLQAEIASRKMQIETQANNAFTRLMNGYIKDKTSVADAECTIDFNNKATERINGELVRMRLELSKLRARYKELKSMKLDFSGMNLICPTCGRPLDIDQIEEKQAEMLENFNRDKAEQLSRNIEQGKALRSEIEKYEARLAGYADDTARLTAEIARLKDGMQEPQPLSRADRDKMIVKDEQYLRLCKRLQDYDKEHADNKTDNTLQEKAESLSAQHKALSDEIADIKTKLTVREVNDANEKRIKELEKQLRQQNEELTRLEGIEFVIQDYTQTRITMLEERINALFSFVKFKMFETQINGGEVETCKAVVNGVPFEDLNSAMQINAGLDIINAFCKTLQMTAPIFIDNSESVNRLTRTDSQIIRLVVSEDENLRTA